MINENWFETLSEEFEESVRVDREDGYSRDPRRQAIDSYHVTTDSQQFITDFFNQTLGRTDNMRTGSNYWIYGYYGSGKSHLLTVMDGLLDTNWLNEQHREVWDALKPENSAASNDLDKVRQRWEQMHRDFHIIPISVNLLKYQGQKQQSLSEIILQHAHQNPQLTGIDNQVSAGLSPQIDVAYFEDWYQTTDEWAKRQEYATDVLRDIVPPAPNYDWSAETVWQDIQEYSALAEVVLPHLFEQMTGNKDGYTDLQPSGINPKQVISRLESLRTEREQQVGKPVRLVLLLDEVSLFIGTDFGRLTELQTVAEKVDEIGNGKLKLVATAQAKIEDTQPQFAAHGADFSILKDRFPHRYQLPSKHVGDIAKRRLFQKTTVGVTGIRQTLADADIKPSESLVYSEIKQDTKPSLTSIDTEELIQFYPFLPYHAPLFLKILFNLRKEASDPAKSIFSGTARAILALMDRLLNDWVETGKESHVISLVKLYNHIRPELRDILTQDVRVIEGSDATRGIVDEVENGSLEEFDLRVAKAVMLLQYVHNAVPMTEGNLAVAVMSDLNGSSRTSTANRVEDSLERLEKYIRPTNTERGPRFRFATQGERRIYEDTEENERNPEWDAILETLDEHLWDHIIQDLSLPESTLYHDFGDEYPVSYQFRVDTTEFETEIQTDSGLDVQIAVQGIHPDKTGTQLDTDTLYWEVDTRGLDELRQRLVEWWALRDAIKTREVPPAVEQDLDRRAETVHRKLVSVMNDGDYSLGGGPEVRTLPEAVQETVSATYPDDFHPRMLEVNETRLQELSALDSEEPLPEWGEAIQVPSVEGTLDSWNTIAENIQALTKRQIHDKPDGLNLETVLDGIVNQNPYYDEVRPALRAILWGSCRCGHFLPVDEDGSTLPDEAVLQKGSSTTTRLKMLDIEDIGEVIYEHNFKETTETVSEGIINIQEANEQLRAKLLGIKEDLELMVDSNFHAPAVISLLSSFESELQDQLAATTKRISIIQSQGDGLPDVIRETAEIQSWSEDVTDTWSRRLPALYNWDAQLTIGDSRFAWLDDSARSAIDARQETVTEFDGEWWTADGWGRLVQEISADLANELTRSWRAFTNERGLTPLVEQVESHPWVVEAVELPGGVNRTFERRFITPLRRFKQWYETVDTAISMLGTDTTEDIRQLADTIADIDCLSDTLEIDIATLESRFEQLSSTVGERTPDDVVQVGIVPDDRQQLERRLERLVEQGDPAIESTDSGVIVR